MIQIMLMSCESAQSHVASYIDRKQPSQSLPLRLKGMAYPGASLRNQNRELHLCS